MTLNAALSHIASNAPLDDAARSLSNDGSAATTPVALLAKKDSDAPPSGSVAPFKIDATGTTAPDENVENDPNNPNVENVEFLDATGRIDWDAALAANESRLRSTIATRVGENAAVDEVFQDVALAATRQKAPIRDPRKIGAWLRRLATVYSLLYRRSVGRKKRLLQRYQDRVPLREISGVDAEPLHWLLMEERRALVREATALLSDDERLILTLKYAEERSYKEIAEETGTTVSAVQSKLHRARARLREKLAELAPTAISPPT